MGLILTKLILVVLPLKTHSKQHHVCFRPTPRRRWPIPIGKKANLGTLYLIVDVAVCKHGVKILDTFLSIPVVIVLQALLYCSHIHWGFNYLVIILPRNKRERSQWELSIAKGTGIPPPHPHGMILHAQHSASNSFSTGILRSNPGQFKCWITESSQDQVQLDLMIKANHEIKSILDQIQPSDQVPTIRSSSNY